MAQEFAIQISNIEQLKAAFVQYPEASNKYFSRAINAALAIISRTGATDSIMEFKTPRSLRTGMLQQSFDLGLVAASPGNLKGAIGPTVEYATYVENGTAAHLIEAINKKCLANTKTGQIFGKSVNHPGSAPNPFMERILAASENDINNTFDTALELATQTLQVWVK